MKSILTKQHNHVYNNLADEYEKNIPNYFEPTKESIEILAKYLKPGAKVLDVGCGTGVASGLLSKLGYGITAIDISENMISYAKKRCPNGRVIIGDFLTYKFSEKYDAIISLAFIHLFPKKIAEKVIDKMFELLRFEGYLYIGTTKSSESREGWELKQDSFFPKSIEKRYRKHWLEWELKESLLKSGFKFINMYLINDVRNKVWMDFLVTKRFCELLTR